MFTKSAHITKKLRSCIHIRSNFIQKRSKGTKQDSTRYFLPVFDTSSEMNIVQSFALLFTDGVQVEKKNTKNNYQIIAAHNSTIVPSTRLSNDL